ncbi:MAG: heme A synthase [Candidatus Wallbacteria bacterium]|nr:heme A synthase [Candidatus Wallbacteria bacterium]
MSEQSSPKSPSLAWMHRYAVLTAVCTFLLIVAGALVKSTGSGLAVPDWPLSFGRLMPEMVGGVFFEHGHRMVATFVGLLTIGLVVWIHRTESRRWVRRLSTISLAIILTQGCLGGMTVLLKLPPIVSIAHAGLAEIFFCVAATMALVTSGWWRRAEGPLPSASALGLQLQCALLTAVVYLQILLGALVRHYGAGLSIRTFPLADGKWIPDIDSFYVGIHFAHRVGAVLVALLAVATAVRLFGDLELAQARRRPDHGLGPVLLPAVALLVIVSGQILLGGYVIWSERAVEMTAAHVATGALTLVTAYLMTLATFRALRQTPAAPVAQGSLTEATA